VECQIDLICAAQRMSVEASRPVQIGGSARVTQGLR
jgi:hypothetical protein